MKVRTDFVTNSSSSSFILSFKDENSIYNTLKEQFPKNIEVGWSCGNNGYLQQLLNEIDKVDRLTKDNIREIIENERFSIKWEIIEKIENEKNISYLEIKDFFKTSEGQKMIDDACKEKIDRIMKDIGDDKVIVEIEHGDGGYGEDGILENEILPLLSCMKAKFSHH